MKELLTLAKANAQALDLSEAELGLLQCGMVLSDYGKDKSTTQTLARELTNNPRLVDFLQMKGERAKKIYANLSIAKPLINPELNAEVVSEALRITTTSALDDPDHSKKMKSHNALWGLLGSYLHDFPGLMVAFRAYSEAAISSQEFESILSVLLFL